MITILLIVFLIIGMIGGYGLSMFLEDRSSVIARRKSSENTKLLSNVLFMSLNDEKSIEWGRVDEYTYQATIMKGGITKVFISEFNIDAQSYSFMPYDCPEKKITQARNYCQSIFNDAVKHVREQTEKREALENNVVPSQSPDID